MTPASSTTIATITSMRVKPLCLRPSLICFLMCTPAEPFVALTNLVPGTVRVAGPELRNSRRQNHHSAVVLTGLGDGADIEDVHGHGIGSVADRASCIKLDRLCRGTGRECGQADHANGASQVARRGNAALWQERHVSREFVLAVRAAQGAHAAGVCSNNPAGSIGNREKFRRLSRGNVQANGFGTGKLNVVGYLRGSGRDLIRPQSRYDGRNGDGRENRDDDHHHDQFEHAEAAARGSPRRSGRKALGSGHLAPPLVPLINSVVKRRTTLGEGTGFGQPQRTCSFFLLGQLCSSTNRRVRIPNCNTGAGSKTHRAWHSELFPKRLSGPDIAKMAVYMIGMQKIASPASPKKTSCCTKAEPVGASVGY